MAAKSRWKARLPAGITAAMVQGSDTPDSPAAGDEVVEPLRRALGERYLTYALSTIMHRALPDARDGLKPVHRRILYAMREMRLEPRGAPRKSAAIVGEVMGKYHPHGDGAIYEAMTRLAQDFSTRYPLVDGQGNFGNIDGDSPAAMRYTEARLTAVAEAMLEGLAEDAADFRPNYDGQEREPVVLPALFPNLLANGSAGIAVGMATNIPPHNSGELIDACLHLIRFPEARDDTLMTIIPGPDFPTGGVLAENPATIRAAYETGRGSLRIRARWAVEDLGRGSWQVVVSEIPYQVQKTRLVEKLAEIVLARKNPMLGDVRDESTDKVRLVLEPKSRSVDPALMMETLFRQSDLETRFAVNLNVLIDGKVPRVCSLREILRAWLDHQRDILRRRSAHRMARIDERLEVLEGLIVAYLNLDRVIAIIRAEDEPAPVMMAEFDLTEVQAEAILNMRLRALRRLEELALKSERDTLLIERAELDDLLASEALQWAAISKRLKETRAAFADPRRTEIGAEPAAGEVPTAAMIEREPLTVVLSAMGWIRALKGHGTDPAEIKYKDGDAGRFVLTLESTDRLLLFASNGRFYTLSAHLLPGGRGMGEPVRLMIDLPNEAEIIALQVHRSGARLLVASDAGDGFVVAADDVLAQTRGGKQVLNLGTGVRAKVCRLVEGDMLAVVGENRKLLVFPLSDLPEMARGKGLRLQKYKDGGLSDARSFVLSQGLSWQDPAGRTRTETELSDWTGPRASAGKMAPRGFPQDNRFTF
jgi:topoisomerase-4 subunit A